MSMGEIVPEVSSHGGGLVEVTGGEPLLQEETPALMDALLKAGFEVLLETSGTRNIGLVDSRCARIVDVKCPCSGMCRENDLQNLRRLTPGDELKFVMGDREDYEFARGILEGLAAPARNTVLLACALVWAQVLGAGDIFIGVNALDYSGYPDCRPAYIEAFDRMANLATRATVEGRVSVRIHAPLIRMTKARIIRKGMELGVDYGMAHSCYDPDGEGRACGRCDS